VGFSGHSDPAIVMETLDNGAHAYVSKDEAATIWSRPCWRLPPTGRT
jgi:DNA-binding NarL/FixJ family response regulator